MEIKHKTMEKGEKILKDKDKQEETTTAVVFQKVK